MHDPWSDTYCPDDPTADSSQRMPMQMHFGGQLMMPMPQTDDRSMIVLHQTMDHEWNGRTGASGADREDWGRQSANDMAAKGFTVVRIRTKHWRDLKGDEFESHRFRNPLHSYEVEQQMICTMNFRDLVAPTAAILQVLLSSVNVSVNELQALMQSHAKQTLAQVRSQHSIAAYDQERATMYYPKYVFIEVLEMLSNVEVIPSHIHHNKQGNDALIMPDVIAVTEASTLMADRTTPRIVRCVYRHYSEKVLWAAL